MSKAYSFQAHVAVDECDWCMMPGPCEVGLGILEYQYGSCYILCVGVNFPGSWMQC